MRNPLLSVALLAPVVLAAGCPGFPAQFCDLSTATPDVADGTGQATRSDGASFTGQDASWAPGSNGSVTVGLLDMITAKDQTGTDTEQLIADGAFPICVTLAERSDTSGSALFNDGGFASNADHTGNVVIIGEEGGFLLGRFQVDLADGSNANLSFTDGQFKARRR
jgi:hypothetical protein